MTMKMNMTTTTPLQLQLANPMVITGIARVVLRSLRPSLLLRVRLPPRLRLEELVRALRVRRLQRQPRRVLLRRLDRVRLRLSVLLVPGCCE
jgi:hypothetical protein